MSLSTPEKIRRLQTKLYVKAKREPDHRFFHLYDKVWREDILEHGYRLAKANGGKPGVDGMTFASIEKGGRKEWLAALREELRAKTYKPDPVRRVMIDKQGGGQRPLGIPTIRDRVAQTAAKLVIEPIFEADFEDCAYGYRPKRSATDAVEAVHRALCEGYTDVVDADLSKYFDTIPHPELMQSVARRISDRWMLKLIKAWLKVPVEERDERGRRRMSGGKKSRRGTPQGGVISPLLANIYMHRFLKGWRQRGNDERYEARIVNYADDFVILSRGHAARALVWTRGAMEWIGLTLNENKTRLCDAHREHFTFLGYTFGMALWRKTGGRYMAARPSKKSVQRVKDRVREVLGYGIVSPLGEVVVRLNRVLRGWGNYFSYGTWWEARRTVDFHVANSMRRFLCRRHKVRTRGTRRFPDERIFGQTGVCRLAVPKAAWNARART